MKSEHGATDNVRELLSELSETDAARLGPIVLSLQSLAYGEVPAPSAELAAALEARRSTPTTPTRRLRRRGLVLSLALIGALVAGTGTAFAVNPQFRSGAAHAINGIINAIPFGHPVVVHPAPIASPSAVPVPERPEKGHSTAHPTPSPDAPAQSNGNGKSSSGHANPRSTDHPTPPAAPPVNGRGGGSP